MAARPISSKLHGVLDYTTGATLTVLPSVLGLGGTRAGRVLRFAGATHAGYSVFTKYELGAVKVLAYRGHLALDAVAAVGLAAAPWLLRTRDEGVRHWLPHVVLGLYELGAVALSDPSGESAASAEPMAAEAAPAPVRSGSSQQAVMPDGAEANAKIGARTIGGSERTGGGVGSGAGPGSDPGVGGQQL